jgi:predicted AAA+ superfamily ATPase
MYKRYLQLKLPVGQSAFLWGARKTGKSTYLKQHYPDAQYFDLLLTENLIDYSQKPYLFRERVLALDAAELEKPIIVDEVQKVPLLLNEIHWLIENSSAYFILCGSSARKLKRGAANLLGGRAWRYTFYPLVYPEIPEFDLLRVLNNGLIPAHYAQQDPSRDLKAYVQDYLKEEIQAEGLTRSLPAFSRFLDALAFSHGQLVNHSNIARDCGVHASTVKAYFQILIDTLLGYEIFPFAKRLGRDLISATPKFYLFDIGIVNAITKRRIAELKGVDAGEAFEHYIFLELMAYQALHELDFEIQYWRTKTGLEVDFVVNRGAVAIEVKISDRVRKSDIKGLQAFSVDYKPNKAIVVSNDPLPRKLQVEGGIDILILPWRQFLDRLWSGDIF